MGKKYVLDTFTTVYEQWGEGADERHKLNEFGGTEVFTHLSEVAEWLGIQGLTSPEPRPAPFSVHTWLSLANGTRVHGAHGHYTGEEEEVMAHPRGFTDREWLSVLNRVAHGSGYRTFTTSCNWRVEFFGAKGRGTAHHVTDPARVVTFWVEAGLVLFRTVDAVPHHLIGSVQRWVTANS